MDKQEDLIEYCEGYPNYPDCHHCLEYINGKKLTTLPEQNPLQAQAQKDATDPDLIQIAKELKQYLNCDPCPDPFPQETKLELFDFISTVHNRIALYYYNPDRTEQITDSELAKKLRDILSEGIN